MMINSQENDDMKKEKNDQIQELGEGSTSIRSPSACRRPPARSRHPPASRRAAPSSAAAAPPACLRCVADSVEPRRGREEGRWAYGLYTGQFFFFGPLNTPTKCKPFFLAIPYMFHSLVPIFATRPPDFFSNKNQALFH